MKKMLTISVIAVCFCGTAWATPSPAIVQMKFFGNTPDMGGAATFNQFNDNGGTYILDSVQVLFHLQTSGGQLILDNDSPEAAAGTFQFGANGAISSTDVILLNSSYMPIPGEVTVFNSEGFSLAANVDDGFHDYDPTPPDGLLYIGETKEDTKSGLVGSSFWGAGDQGFLGAGTYDIDYSVSQWLNYGGISGIEYAVTPVYASGYVEVDYDYHVVPEPATIGLLGLGALSLIRRKR
jgi:hypothetical protein